MIDVNSGDEKLHINLDITLEKAPCHVLSLDIVEEKNRFNFHLSHPEDHRLSLRFAGILSNQVQKSD